MPDLRAFRGLRYDPAAVPDLGAVLCPPYDVISSSERDRFADRDQHNAVHLELPTAYESASRALEHWMADGVLRRDERPLVYVYEQRYSLGDRAEQAARGFFCQLRLEPYGARSGVRPHERTMSAPKEDRFRLLSAVRVNLSPVLLIYETDDGGRSSARLIDSIASSAPLVEAIGPDGRVQRLWAADPDEQPEAQQLLRLAGERPLTIADGHHRYETGLRYRDEVGGAPGADFLLALLYDARSGGLALLPWHRVVTEVADVDRVLAAAAELFLLTRCSDAEQLRLALAAAQPNTLGLWTRQGGGLLSVDRDRIDPLIPAGGSDALRWLDVSVLSGTLRRMIGRTSEELEAEGRLSYVSDGGQAVESVESGAADVAFLLRPTPIDSVLAVAAAGEHMPAKSTFFHPKAATGLVFNPLF